MHAPFSSFVRNCLFAEIIAGVISLAFYLRFSGIDARPMHSDEAVQAYRVGQMLAGTGFIYNPQDFHGPTLYYFSFWLCKLIGITSFSEMTETLVRAVPAGIGALGCVLIPVAFFGKKIIPVLLSGLLLACSKIACFYSGYFIQEIILVVFAWSAAGIWFFRKKTIANAVLAGICAGIAVASKETWTLMFAAFALGGNALFLLKKHFNEAEESAGHHGKRLAAATLSAVAVAALFYSSFGQNPGGLTDFFVAFKNYFFAGTAAESPHAKPFFYYVKLLGGNERFLLFVAFIFAVPFLLRVFFPIRKERKFECTFDKKDFSLPLFIFTSGLFILVFYSVIPYKTPWCALGIVPGIALIPAAMLNSRVLKTVYKNGLIRAIVSVFLFWLLCLLPSSGGFPALAYEHTCKSILEIAPAVQKSKADFIREGNKEEDFFIALVAPEYWPLPWYLRRERVGVWENLSQVPARAAVSIAEIEAWAEADAAETATKKSRTIFCAGLRPGIIIEARENFPKN